MLRFLLMNGCKLVCAKRMEADNASAPNMNVALTATAQIL